MFNHYKNFRCEILGGFIYKFVNVLTGLKEYCIVDDFGNCQEINILAMLTSIDN